MAKMKKETKYAAIILLTFALLIVVSVMTVTDQWTSLGKILSMRMGRQVIEIAEDETPLGMVSEDMMSQSEVKVVNDSITVKFSFNAENQGLTKPVIVLKFRAYDHGRDVTDQIGFEIPKAVFAMNEVHRVESLDVLSGYNGCEIFFEEGLTYSVKGSWTFQLTDLGGGKLSEDIIIEGEGAIADAADTEGEDATAEDM
ncbi:MAG: hypothetical protein LBL26_07195 [Peptococcaceae bacterium]|jgi:hypothetical protein|nr:hypothetical protein [Peptococcaceae bacterium]